MYEDFKKLFNEIDTNRYLMFLLDEEKGFIDNDNELLFLRNVLYYFLDGEDADLTFSFTQDNSSPLGEYCFENVKSKIDDFKLKLQNSVEKKDEDDFVGKIGLPTKKKNKKNEEVEGNFVGLIKPNDNF